MFQLVKSDKVSKVLLLSESMQQHVNILYIIICGDFWTVDDEYVNSTYSGKQLSNEGKVMIKGIEYCPVPIKGETYFEIHYDSKETIIL